VEDDFTIWVSAHTLLIIHEESDDDVVKGESDFVDSLHRQLLPVVLCLYLVQGVDELSAEFLWENRSLSRVGFRAFLEFLP